MGNSKETKKNRITICVLGVITFFIGIPLLLKIPAIKGVFSWWLDFTDNPDYKITYIEVVFGIIGVFLSVLGALRTEGYFRKREEKKAIEECVRFIHAELNRCFYKLQLIFRETRISCNIEDTGPDFRNAFCEVAKKHKLDLNNEWISHMAQLNGRISKSEWNTLQMYFSRLAVIDQALESGNNEEISNIYAPFICFFITTGGKGIFLDVAKFLEELEKKFENNK